MRRDVIVSVFLFFVLFALVFVVLFPIYFAYGQIFYRSVSVAERIMSVIFVLFWFMLCAYSAYFRRLTCLLGGVIYSALAYLPGIVLPRLSTATPGSDPNLTTSLLDGFFRRLYELVNAPMVGISVLFPPGKAVGIGKLLLPLLIVSYIATQIFRFYRNAYLADQLLLNDVTGRQAVLLPKKPDSPKVKTGGRIAAFLSGITAERPARAVGSPGEEKNEIAEEQEESIEHSDELFDGQSDEQSEEQSDDRNFDISLISDESVRTDPESELESISVAAKAGNADELFSKEAGVPPEIFDSKEAVSSETKDSETGSSTESGTIGIRDIEG